MPRYGRRRFGGGRTAVSQSTSAARKRGKCRACRGYYEKGESIVVLRLRKSLRVLACGHTLPGTKRFHPACIPTDLHAAMGYDPSKAPVDPASAPSGGAIPPPPKPPTPEEMQLAAIVAIQNCVKARARGNPVYKQQVDDTFKRFQKMTALGLRPGTDAEGLAALRAALIQSIKLVF